MGHRQWNEQTDHGNAEIIIIIIITCFYKVPFFTRVHSVLQLTYVCEVPFFTRVHSVVKLLTPSLPQPVKFLGWKVHPYTPEKSVLDGNKSAFNPVPFDRSPLMCSCEGEKSVNDFNLALLSVVLGVWFQFGTFMGCFGGVMLASMAVKGLTAFTTNTKHTKATDTPMVSPCQTLSRPKQPKS